MAANEQNENSQRFTTGDGDVEWETKITVLRLLVRKVKKVNIALQVGYSEKWVRDVEKEALNYPVSLIITLPQEIQDYIVKKAKTRPKLSSEIEKMKSAEENKGKSPLPIDHRIKLSEMLHKMLPSIKAAREFETDKNVKFAYLVLTPKELNGTEYIDDKKQNLLLQHIKSEIPELEKFDSWYDLTAADLTNDLLDQLTVIDLRGTLKGRCEACPKIMLE